jgi:hypothetical protein
MEPVFFADAAELRAWFEQHHEQAPELLVGYWKKGSGQTGVTHSEAIEQGLMHPAGTRAFAERRADRVARS